MTKKMLIDATHSEETRVAVVDNNRLIDFDYESQVRKQLKGSIFLAKVTRVEPSLQAAFVNFGGNRHGFLPFTEIHPDYYRIPIADREAILAEQEREMEARRAAEEAEDSEEEDEGEDADADADDVAEEDLSGDDEEEDEDGAEVDADAAADSDAGEDDDNIGNRKQRGGRNNNSNKGRGRGRGRGGRRMGARGRKVEVLGGDGIEGDQPIRPSFRRNYKIQEVVKRGQIMLVQVSKEERGNKGAAVSTYLSLPGRYCVLMPNSPRAGGVSRKIANFKERKRMREILNELKVPQGMSVIMRTAGTSRTKAEIKRDLDYLMKLWDNIRELTLESTAPALVHEEGKLVRRSIRDIYAPDIEEVVVAGEESYKMARDFMKMMIPSHVKKVKEYKDEQIPLFHRYQVESQINEIGDPVVTLPSGGYLVINPTEALVSVDVNSGKATKERHIEETALRTNLEAAEEVARQLRLRDLGGLVVIDFIDMEDRRNNRKVENKMRDALANERARIQIGRISSFGLMELSRQRLNPSLTEAQYEKCSYCQGTGNVRTVDAAAIMALRALEEEGIRNRSQEVILHLSNGVALYILNNKRHRLAEIEQRFGFTVMIRVNDELAPSRYLVEPIKSVSTGDEDEEVKEKTDQSSSNNNRPAADDSEQQGSGRGGRRRRGRRGGRRRNNRDDQQNDNRNQNQNSEQAEQEQKFAKPDQEEVKAEPKAKDAEAVQGDVETGAAGGEDKKTSAKATKKRASRKKTAKKDEGVDQGKEAKAEAGADTKADVKTDEQPAEKADDKGAGEDAAAKKPSRKKAPARKAASKKAASGEKRAAKAPEDKASAAKDSDKKDADKKSAGKKESNVTEMTPPAKEAAPAQDKDFEVVNEPPAQKKKGWWNKFTD